MNIDAILDASERIEQWKNSANHVAPWSEAQVLEIVQTEQRGGQGAGFA